MQEKNIKHIIVAIIAVCVGILGAFGFYVDNKDKSTEEIIQATVNEVLQEIVVTEETQELANNTIEDTLNNEDLSTTETIESTPEEEQALEPDAIVEQENISYNGDNTGNGLSLLGSYQGLTYYSQADSRWANTMYSSIGDRSQTMKSSACGPTSAAMVVSSSKGTILPTTMANLAVDNGYRTAGNGTAWAYYPFVADYFGFSDYANISNLDTAINYLRQGYYVVTSVGSGLFTTGGHYIVLVGIDGNTLQIYDPYLYSGKFNTASRSGKVTVSGNTVYCSISNFRNYANYKQFWCYSNDHGTGNIYVNNKYGPGSYVTNTRLNVRASATTNSRLITTLEAGSRQGVDYTVNNWGHLMNGAGWICLDYCSSINTPATTTNTKYSPGSYQVTASTLNVRADANTNSRVVTKLYNGSKQGIDYTVGIWGHLLNNAGWICLDYCRPYIIDRSRAGSYKITASALNVREDANTNSRVITKLYAGSRQAVDYNIGNWGHLQNNAGWICLDYCVGI